MNKNDTKLSNEFLSNFLEIPFFISELLKWISVQEIGRLKCTCKKIQSKFTLETIRPILEENLIFKSLIFRNQLEIIEQIIPFKYNNRKHKFPKLILSSLFNKAAKEGKISLISKLLSSECRDIFGYLNAFDVMRISSENGHFEILKLVFSKFRWLFENRVDLLYWEDHFSIDSIMESIQVESLRTSCIKHNRETLKWLLSQTNINHCQDKHLLLTEIENYSKSTTSATSTTTDTEWIEYLWFLTSMYLFTGPNLFSHFDITIRNENFENHLNWLTISLNAVHPKLIKRWEILPCDDEEDTITQRDIALNKWICWYVFIDDYENFLKCVEKFSAVKHWPLMKRQCFQCPLESIIEFTMEKNLSRKYFDVCLDACKSLNSETTTQKQDLLNEFHWCIRNLIQFNRIDLLKSMLEFSPKSQVFPEAMNIAILHSFEMVKFLLPYAKNENCKVSIEKVMDGDDLEIAKILYASNMIKFSDVNWYSCGNSFSANYDLFHFFFECEEFQHEMKKHEINGLELLRVCWQTKDEDFLKVLFSQATSKFRNLWTPKLFSSSLELEISKTTENSFPLTFLSVFRYEYQKLCDANDMK